MNIETLAGLINIDVLELTTSIDDQFDYEYQSNRLLSNDIDLNDAINLVENQG